MTDLTKKPTPSTAIDVLRPGAARPVEVYLQGHRAMLPDLRRVVVLLGRAPEGETEGATAAVRDFPWQDLRYEHMEAIRARLVERFAPATARLTLTAIRGVLHTAWKMRAIDRETYERTIDVAPISGDGEPAGRMLTNAEILRIFATTDARDGAIVALALYCGLRRVELSRLNVADVAAPTADDATVKLTVRQGKGNKYREVYVPPIASARLAAWLDARGLAPGPLFARAWRGGHVRGGSRLSPSGVWKVIVRAAKEVGIDDVTPHDFRRTFASTLFDVGVDLVTVQNLMGHANPTTTSKYDRRGDERKKRAAKSLADAFEK